MKPLYLEEFKTLVQHPQDICISIFLPTYRTEPGIQQNPIRLRNLIREAEEKLIERGWRADDAKDLLQPVKELDKYEFWRHQSDGLAIFCAHDLLRYYCLPVGVQESVVVNDHFYLKPLLPLFNRNGHFYILALSQSQIRLLEGTRHTVEEVEISGVLPTPEEVLRFEAPERQIPSHTGTPGAASSRRAATGGVTTFHGHGAGDEDDKENLLLYFHRVDEALRELLRLEVAPLVLAGVEYLLPIYREANSYPYVMESAIPGNAETLKPEELHAKAWQIVEPYFLQAQQKAIALCKELIGTGKASSDISETVRAACQGRVDSLFVAQGQHQWGTFDRDTQRVNLHSHAEPNDEDLLDFAAMETILNGGTVYALEASAMPNRTAIAAVFRY